MLLGSMCMAPDGATTCMVDSPDPWLGGANIILVIQNEKLNSSLKRSETILSRKRQLFETCNQLNQLHSTK